MGLENPRIEDGLTIDLAQERDFRLDGLSVIPSAREIIQGGMRETLEPRVMQVLVALVRADGTVVSRDELIQSCWEGRVVGEDSINRVIWRLRKLANGTPPPFVIETIPRVGYRLKSDRPRPVPRPDVAVIAAQHFGWWRPAIVCLATAAIVLAVWSSWPMRPGGSSALAPILTENGEPAFAPDGTMLTYVAAPGMRQVYVRGKSGSESLGASGDGKASPSWSPDGKWLAYVTRESGGTCRIIIAALKQGKARQAVRCKAAETSSLAWQPGTSFLYFTDQAGAAGNAIFRLDLESGKVQPMTGTKQAAVNWR